MSGPAVYRHFSGKQALLGALLVGVSEDLLAGGQAVLAATPDADASLRALVAFHVDFALTKPDVIRVQDRDLDSLSDADRLQVQVPAARLCGAVGRRRWSSCSPSRDLPCSALAGAGSFWPDQLHPAQRVHGRTANGAARAVLERHGRAAFTLARTRFWPWPPASWAPPSLQRTAVTARSTALLGHDREAGRSQLADGRHQQGPARQ